ncbi:hypothetical protein D3C86_1764460 [compost metagenome]
MVSRLRSVPRRAASLCSVTHSALAKAQAAHSARPMPSSHSGPALSLARKRAGTSRANSRPSRIRPISQALRRVGGGPPSAQLSRARMIGKVLAASRARATGMRATAEYRQRLWMAISRPSSSCQRQVPGGRRSGCRCQARRAASTSRVTPERQRIASSTPVP